MGRWERRHAAQQSVDRMIAKQYYASLVPCPGCIKRGVKPESVRKGTQCNTCADIEEGAF